MIFICACCVDPFNTSLSGKETLVVDGLITDQPGPQTITLSYSSRIGIGEFTRVLASGASVAIIDNSGTQTQLNEVSSGVYQSDPSYRAQQGQSYFVRINLNGEIYESDVESLQPVGQLDSLYFKFQTSSTAPQFEIYANSTKPQQSAGLMRWRSSFTYEIITGYLVLQACWVSGQNTGVAISNGSNFINNKFNNNLIATIPIGDKQFEFKYYLKVDQLSLSVSAYNFWNLVMSQRTGSTSLFQPASALIQGNIHSRTNPNEQVLGIFQVSSVSSKSIFIDRSDIPLDFRPSIPTDLADCSNEGTPTPPPFW